MDLPEVLSVCAGVFGTGRVQPPREKACSDTLHGADVLEARLEKGFPPSCGAVGKLGRTRGLAFQSGPK